MENLKVEYSIEYFKEKWMDKETIFSYNPTETELKRFGGLNQFVWADTVGLDIYSSNDNRLYHLGLLFSMRKNDKKANEYWCKIENKIITVR